MITIPTRALRDNRVEKVLRSMDDTELRRTPAKGMINDAAIPKVDKKNRS